MVNKLKRMNRGIILAVIAVIVLIVYIVYDEATFKAERPELQEMVQNYFERLEEAAIVDDKYIDKKTNSINNEGKAKQKQQYTNIINEFMTNSPKTLDNRGLWSPDKQYLISMVNSFISEGDGHVTKYDYEINGIEITKEGPGYALIRVDYEMTIETKGGSTAGLVPGGISLYGDFHYDGMQNASNKDTETRYIIKASGFNRFEIDARKINGEWKFYGLRDWSGYQSVMLNDDFGDLYEEGYE